MADKRISELVTANSVTTADYMAVVQAGSTLKMDFNTLFANVPRRINVRETSEAPLTGAIALTKLVTKVSAPSAASTAYTLAAGVHGDEKIIVASIITATFLAVVTVSGGTGVTTITFNSTGDAVQLLNIDGAWYVTSNSGAIVA